jgi:hypothetical protein
VTAGAVARRCMRALAFVAGSGLGCGRGGSPGLAAAGTGSAGAALATPAASSGEGEPLPPMDPIEADEWARASAGDEDAFARLVGRIGCDGVRERSRDPALRSVALRAMGYCPDFAELPWLADIATRSGDGEAADALGAILDEASRPRRARDPDDAEELAEGCGKLLALARAKSAPKARRVGAIRALRMLAERGCVKWSDIPTDLDAPAVAARERDASAAD